MTEETAIAIAEHAGEPFESDEETPEPIVIAKAKRAPRMPKVKPAKADAPIAKRKTKAKAAKKTKPLAKEGSKKAIVLGMLRTGASLDALMKRLGWQAHSVRGIVSTLGRDHKIESEEMQNGGRKYKLLAS